MKKINIDYKIMENFCLADVDQFKAIKGAQTFDTPDGPLIYFDNGSDILAVAHLDSVQTKAKHFYHVIIGNDDIVFNAQLDDRLGAYIIMNLLPSLGIAVDVLLTWGEEVGKSTAKYFKPDKTYKWMVQFDRMGDDVVHYMYGEEKFKKALKDAGFTGIQYGMKSDICYLEHLGCRGFNLGIGYEDYHDVWAKADMDVVRDQVNIFREFYHRNKKKHWKYEKPKPHVYTPAASYPGIPSAALGGSWWENYKWDSAKRIYVPKVQEGTTPEADTNTSTEVVLSKDQALHTKSGKVYSRGDVCMACDSDLNSLDDAETEIFGVCSFCEWRYGQCTSCQEVFLNQEMRGDLCYQCIIKKNKEPGNELTLVECTRCYNHMYASELKVNGSRCAVCLEWPNDEWWKEGFDWTTPGISDLAKNEEEDEVEEEEEDEVDGPFLEGGHG